MTRADPVLARERLRRAGVMLVLTPDLCAGRDPLVILALVLPFVDVVQVRPKPLGDRAPGAAPMASITSAREAWVLSRQVLELVAASDDPHVPVLVNDRVDVALALADEGLAGVHLGDEDLPVDAARELLGPDALIGLSTHSIEDVARAEDLPVDYLGFGPVFATPTKGYDGERAGGRPALVGAELAWLASGSAAHPVFPIGGIDLTNADELVHAGRAAVGACLLAAKDPAAAARELRELLDRD